MGYKSMSVQMTPEHFDRSIKGSPKEAIKEIIWNECVRCGCKIIEE